MKLAEGNRGKRRINDAEPKPKVIALEKMIKPARGPEAWTGPEPPGALHEDAKKLWREVGREMIELGLLTTMDLPAFAGMCEHWAVWLKSVRDVKEHGLFVEVQGVKVPNPAVTLMRQHAREYRAFAVEFGMTPSSRSRIQIEKPPEADEVEALLKEAQGRGAQP